MTEQLATWLVRGLFAYAFLGLIFATFFVFRGVDKVDPVARESSFGFRLIILPGAVALWPLLLGRWLTATSPPTERNAHRDATTRST